jgi:hypothetical protein
LSDTPAAGARDCRGGREIGGNARDFVEDRMAEIDMSKLHPIFLSQGEYLARRDLDGLMSLYHPEAEVLRYDGVKRGRDEIRAMLERYLQLDLEFVKLNEYVATADTILLRGTMKVKGEIEISCGTYVLKDGKIWRQTGAVEGGARGWGF